jgi:hypothetical protein
MANTVLQIRRSNTTAIPASLFVGELAYSGNSTSNSLFIGHPDGSTGVIRIGGGKYGYLHQATPGVNAANTVRITDANAFISNTYTAGLFVSASIASPTANSTAALITTITPQANSTQLGSSATGSNTELVTSYAIKTYVDGKTSSLSAAGSNQQIQFNNSGVFGADATFTFNSANDTLSVGNTVITGTLTTVGSSLILSTAAAAPVITLASNATTSNTTISGNNLAVTPVATFANGIVVTGAVNTGTLNTTGIATLQSANINGLTTINANLVVHASNAYINTQMFTVSTNSTVQPILAVSNGTVTNTTISGSNFIVSPATALNGAVTVSNTLNVTGLSTLATANVTGLANVSSLNVAGSGTVGTQISVGANVVINTTALGTGNSTVYTNVTSAGITSTGSLAAASMTATANINAANFIASANVNAVNMTITGVTTHSGVTTFNSNVIVNSTGFYVNAATITLASNATVNTFAITSNATVTNTNINGTNFIVSPATALNGAVTVSNTLNVTGLSTMATANVTGLANVSSLNVAGAGTVGTSLSVGANSVVNTTGIGVGNSSVYTNTTSAGITSTGSISAANFTATANISAVNMNISGNLVISGTTTSVDTVTLQVKDNFVKVAANNAALATDVVDFGFYGAANTGGVATYYGLARSAANNGMILFSTTTEPGATTLTAPTLMALSTASITLTTALAATSGGTGTNTYTTGDMIYASATNTLSKRAAGVEGQVLQMLSGVPTWGAIDGGTF